MLIEFATWWAEQMRDLLPASWSRRSGGQDSALVVSVSDADLELSQRSRRRVSQLGRFGSDDAGLERARAALAARAHPKTMVLVPPADTLLEREVTLPLAAERDAGRVLGYEMDRLTPFTAQDVFWTWAVIQRDRVRGVLRLRLSLVPRTAVADSLSVLDRIGVIPTVMEAQAPDGAMRVITMSNGDSDGGIWRKRAMAGGLGLCGVLAAAAMAIPFLRQSAEMAAVEARIETLQPRVQLVEQMRRRLAGTSAGADVVAAERARTGDLLELLAVVTDILPDDTFLTDFTMNQGKLGLAGQSAAAAKLIPALAAEPLLKNPIFIAPVTRNETGAADLFSIRAELGS